MQLIPRYLVDNRTTVLVSELGHVTEYRPVYTKQIKLYKGIDNALQFKLLNADANLSPLLGKRNLTLELNIFATSRMV